MRFHELAAMFGMVLTGASCARAAPDRVGPSPEAREAPSPSVAPAPLPPALAFAEVYCQYGGTAPAFFVWAETVHLEVFGGLAFTAFGPKVDYPTEDRAFHAGLVADQGMWTLTGTCVVGPAG